MTARLLDQRFGAAPSCDDGNLVRVLRSRGTTVVEVKSGSAAVRARRQSRTIPMREQDPAAVHDEATAFVAADQRTSCRGLHRDRETRWARAQTDGTNVDRLSHDGACQSGRDSRGGYQVAFQLNGII